MRAGLKEFGLEKQNTKRDGWGREDRKIETVQEHGGGGKIRGETKNKTSVRKS